LKKGGKKRAYFSTIFLDTRKRKEKKMFRVLMKVELRKKGVEGKSEKKKMKKKKMGGV